MHYDAVIIGAGMSGLAGGIRLAHFDRKVCILERHEVYGGLNSFYRLGKREFDVGLHAMTNYAPPNRRSAPLNRLLRQLRIPREEFDLRPQGHSEVRFGECTLRFSNDPALLEQEVAERFPACADGFRTLVELIRGHDDTALDAAPGPPARCVLSEHFGDPLLVEMLMCPILFYGSPTESDLAYTPFVTLFKSILLEGFARPRAGVRTVLKALIRRFRACGGQLKTNCGVSRIENDGQIATRLVLDSGEEMTADVVCSSIGALETQALCPGTALFDTEIPRPGRLSFVESVNCLSCKPTDIGLDACVVFANDTNAFAYERPEEPVDLRSRVVCCPNNFEGHQDMSEGVVRFTNIANYDAWADLDDAAYEQAKRHWYERTLDAAGPASDAIRRNLLFRDFFTPRTIERFTGHIGGAVYGSPQKIRSGRTRLNNLFLCGTDQGFLGIVGAMLSGISMVNKHVFQEA